MNVLDLFSGIGGFSLGLEHAGMRTSQFCEIDKFCQRVLRKHWPDIPIHSDIKTFEPDEGSAELICGGYPCQPFSVAGKRKAEEDERHLWPEMLRIIRRVRPRWVIAENVAGHIQLGFDEVAASLEAENFTVWPFVIPACAVGAQHRRDRLWIIANTKSRKTRRNFERRLSPNAFASDASNAKSITRQPSVGWLWSDVDRGASTNASNERREGRISETLSGFEAFAWESSGGFTQFSNGWSISASRLCRVDDGIPDRTHRLRSLGNAIVPQIAALIGEAITNYERENT